MCRMLSSGFRMGSAGIAKAVFGQPLDVADPDGGLGQLVGVGVDLDAVQLGRVDGGEETAHAQLTGQGDDFLFQVEKLAQGDVEKVAAPAGGVEHLDGGDFGGKTCQAALLARWISRRAGPFAANPFCAAGGLRPARSAICGAGGPSRQVRQSAEYRPCRCNGRQAGRGWRGRGCARIACRRWMVQWMTSPVRRRRRGFPCLRCPSRAPRRHRTGGHRNGGFHRVQTSRR